VDDLRKGATGEQHVQDSTEVNMSFTAQEHPTQRICLPACTRQGSAWLGELRIFLESSSLEAMTMKLFNDTSTEMAVSVLSFH